MGLELLNKCIVTGGNCNVNTFVEKIIKGKSIMRDILGRAVVAGTMIGIIILVAV